MENDFFLDQERVIVALNCKEICGYCTVSKIDCIPNVPYSPYIGYVFVGEAHRGNRLSEKLVEFSIDQLRRLGFDKVYIHDNLYEKYGFEVVDQKQAPWGSIEKIYVRKL